MSLQMHKQKYLKLFALLDEFWKIGEFEPREENHRRITFARKWCKIYCLFTLTTYVVWCVTPFFTKKLPADEYLAKRVGSGDNLYVFLCFVQILSSFSGFLPVISSSAMTGYILVCILCETKSLRWAYSTIGNTRDSNEFTDYGKIKVLIDHHNLVLKCIKVMNEIYSFWTLIFFATITLYNCTNMLTVVLTG